MVVRLNGLPLSDDLPMAEWQWRRGRMAGVGGALEIQDHEDLTDDLSMGAWQALRGRQVRGEVRPVVLAQASVRAPTQVEGVVVEGRRPQPPPNSPKPAPLTGRPGLAAAVAGAVNDVVAGPNTRGDFNDKERRVSGTIRRGSGRDVSATAKVQNIPEVGASGVLDPPSGAREVSVSGVRGRGIGLPERVRIYTTPTGELDVDLSGPIRLGPIVLKRKGTYVIGTPDAPKAKPGR